MLCYRYMTECDADAHIASIRALYRHKCGLMLDALDAAMPSCVTFTRPAGGLFIWVTLPGMWICLHSRRQPSRQDCGLYPVLPSAVTPMHPRAVSGSASLPPRTGRSGTASGGWEQSSVPPSGMIRKETDHDTLLYGFSSAVRARHRQKNEALADALTNTDALLCGCTTEDTFDSRADRPAKRGLHFPARRRSGRRHGLPADRQRQAGDSRAGY